MVLGAGIFVSVVRPTSPTFEADKVTTAALAKAREALIGYAVTRPNRPGALPCPDTDNDGQENWNPGLIDCAGYVGRLPWLTLGVGDLRDGSGERLWYALSPSFRDSGTAAPLNTDTPGALTITGLTPATQVIALILAPGTVVAPQVRDAANINAAPAYLESENNNGDLIYTTALATPTFNDRMLAITSDSLFRPVTMLVAKGMHNALESYRTNNGVYPSANPYSAGAPYPCQTGLQDGRIPLSIVAGCGGPADWGTELPAWFSANNWNLVTHYGMDNACVLQLTSISTAVCSVVIVTGRAMTGQTRPCANAANCLEDAENTNGDAIYAKPSLASNDRMAAKCSAAAPCPPVP